MRKRPEPIPDRPGDKIILRKQGRQTEITMHRSTKTANGIRYRCEGKTYDTTHEAFMALFGNGWSGSTIRIERKNQITNNPKNQQQ